MLKVEIKIKEKKRIDAEDITAIGCECEIEVNGSKTTTIEEIHAWEYLKEKLEVGKGTAISNKTNKTNEEILNMILSNL